MLMPDLMLFDDVLVGGCSSRVTSDLMLVVIAQVVAPACLCQI